MFPETRMRRLRRNGQIRRLNQETRIHLDQLIYPLFIIEGENIVNEISSMQIGRAHV